MVVPDDERADHGGSYVGVGLLSLVMVAVFFALFVLPPAFAAGFILRGRPLLRAVGFGLAGSWLVGVVVVGRRLMSARPRP